MTIAPYTKQPSYDWNTIQCIWAGTYIDGTPAEGKITIKYDGTGPMLDDDVTLPLSVFTAGVDIPIVTTTVLISGETRTVGYASINLPATNDPDILGGGGTFTFSEKLTRDGGRTDVSFVVDKDAPNGKIFLNKVPGAIPSSGVPLSVVYWTDFIALESRVDALESVGGLTVGSILNTHVATNADITLDKTADYVTAPGRLALTNAERAKLNGVATGATANATDAQLRDRGTHTGTQLASTISDFTEAAQDAIAALLVSGANVTLTYNDAGNTLTVTAVGGDAELMRDTIGAALVGINGIVITPNDVADTITISVSGIAISAVTNLQTTLDAKLAKTSNLADLANVTTAKTNLGLHTVATTGSAGDLTGDPLPDNLLSTAGVAGKKWNGSTFVVGKINLFTGGVVGTPPVGMADGDVWIYPV